MAEQKKTVEATVRNIRRATRKKYTSKEKVRIVLEGLLGESTIAELCRKEGVPPNCSVSEPVRQNGRFCHAIAKETF